jgi:hypothetical protein
MTNDDGRKPEGAPERSPKAGADHLFVPACATRWPSSRAAAGRHLGGEAGIGVSRPRLSRGGISRLFS